MNTIKEEMAIQMLISRALHFKSIRVKRKSDDVFILQAKVAEGSWITLQTLDLNAAPVQENKMAVPEIPPTTEEQEVPQNVVQFKPKGK